MHCYLIPTDSLSGGYRCQVCPTSPTRSAQSPMAKERQNAIYYLALYPWGRHEWARKEGGRKGGNGALKNVACPLSMISLHVKRRVLAARAVQSSHARFRAFYSAMDRQVKEGSVLEAIWHKEPPTNSFPLPPQPPLIVGCQMPTLNKGWRDARRWRRSGISADSMTW